MRRFFSQLLEISVLRAGPQDLPASGTLLALVLAAHYGTGVALGLFTDPWGLSLLAALVGTLTTVALTQLLLLVRRRQPRFAQTLTALAGCEVLAGLLSIPITAWFYAAGDGPMAPVLLSFVLLVWSVAFTGHIFRHALDVPFALGIALAIIYLVVSTAIAETFLGG